MKVSFVVCGYTMKRWPRLKATLENLGDQSRPPDEVILVADHNDELYEEFRALGVGRVLRNEEERGVSGARNTGWRHASGEIVTFLDDDATPESDWLERLVAPLEADNQIMATSGWVVPDGDHVPEWYPREFYWVFGCSWAGLETRTALRNPLGASMAWRREALAAIGGFKSIIGRNAHARRGPGRLVPAWLARKAPIMNCEETLAGIAARATVGGSIVQLHDSVARHYVPAERVGLSYLWRRSWGEGISKSLVRRLSSDSLSEERRHVGRILGRLGLAVLHPSQWRTALFLSVGLLATSAGYVHGRLLVRPTALKNLPERSSRQAGEHMNPALMRK